MSAESAASSHPQAQLSFLKDPILKSVEQNVDNNVRLDALIFASDNELWRLLLLQSYANFDPYAFSTSWGVPCDSPKASDRTLLGALSRIVNEQTGLQLHGVGLVAEPKHTSDELHTRIGRRQRTLRIVVQVKELQPYLDADRPALQTSSTLINKNSSSFCSPDYRSIPISLADSLHSQHMWATKNELEEFLSSGLFPSEDQEDLQELVAAFDQIERCLSPGFGDDIDRPSQMQTHIPASDMSQATSNTASTPLSGQGQPQDAKIMMKRKRSSKNKQASSFMHKFSVREGNEWT